MHSTYRRDQRGNRKLFGKISVERGEFAPLIFVCCFVIFIHAAAFATYKFYGMPMAYREQVSSLKETAETAEETEKNSETEKTEQDTPDTPNNEEAFDKGAYRKDHEQTMPDARMLYDMEELHGMNPDIVGWLTIPGTNVDYPVMQTPDNEDYYLDKDFQKNYNANGCLIMDTDSRVGSGTLENQYADGTFPSTNLIIHGHNMKNGDMFGNLDKYRTQDYEKAHSKIELSTLTEKREYEIVSVFLSQVYLKSQTDVFKYYKFFEADTQEEFDDFYDNIKKLQLYDTGVTAEFGDEFITLSVCTYHVENGRLAVVAKRILD